MEIPKEYQEFCKEVAGIARKYKLQDFRGAFNPPIRNNQNWHSLIEFSWQQGRHGVAANNLSINSQVWVNTMVEEKDGKED